ncbi:MAG: hypothetical protein AB1941_08400 [Gemmatimonadota bacterium]
MSDKGGAYEHQTDMTGFGKGENTARTNEHAESTIEPTTRNEIDVQGRNRDLPDPDEVRRQGATQPHGPETHQDTKFARKSGS